MFNKVGDLMEPVDKKKPLIFEGALAEMYKSRRNKWIRLSIVSTLLPLFFAGCVSFYNGSFDFLNMFGSGEIVLSNFSLTIPMVFDLFEMKEKEDEYLSWTFFYCAILVCIQIGLYCLIRIDISENKQIKSVISSIIMLVASWICCNYSIRALFRHSTEKRSDKNA